MREHLLAIIAAAAVMFGASTTTSAAPLTVDVSGVIGAADGLAGDNPGTAAAILAQAILDLALNADFSSGGRQWWSNSFEDYSGAVHGNIVGPGSKTDVPDDGSNPITLAAGFTYAIAKYDGKNAGWVLFYLPTFGNSLPANSFSIWGDNPDKYRISNYTLFNPTSVPDGGHAAALLGSALLGLSLLRRRFGR
jgi:hypothetical protein